MSAGFSNITTKTTTVVHTGPCHLDRIVVGNPGTAWVLTIYDGIDATGMKIATVTAGTQPLVFNLACVKGIAVVGTGTTAGDATVLFS